MKCHFSRSRERNGNYLVDVCILLLLLKNCVCYFDGSFAVVVVVRITK